MCGVHMIKITCVAGFYIFFSQFYLLHICFFQYILYFIQNWLNCYKCVWQKSVLEQVGLGVIYMSLPEQIIDLFEILIKASFVFGIPLMLVFTCYAKDE